MFFLAQVSFATARKLATCHISQDQLTSVKTCNNQPVLLLATHVTNCCPLFMVNYLPRSEQTRIGYSVSYSPREIELIELASRGYTDRQISSELNISKDTVASYWRRLLTKSGAASRTELTARYSIEEANKVAERNQQDSEKLIHDLSQQLAVQNQLLMDREALQGITKASLAYIGGKLNSQESFESLLNLTLAHCNTNFGLLAECLPSIEGPLLNTLAIKCNTVAPNERLKPSLRRPIHAVTQALNQNEPIIDNAPITVEWSLGYTTQDDKIQNVLVLPIMNESQLLGVLAVGDRQKEFTLTDVQSLQPFVESFRHFMLRFKEAQGRADMMSVIAHALERMQSILDSFPDGVALESHNGLIEYANPAFNKIFRVANSPSSTVGQPIKTYLEQCSNLTEPATMLTIDSKPWIGQLTDSETKLMVRKVSSNPNIERSRQIWIFQELPI